MSVALDSSFSTAIAGAAAAGRIPATASVPKATASSRADLAAANEVYHQRAAGGSEDTERGRGGRRSEDRNGRPAGGAAAVPPPKSSAPPPASSSSSSASASTALPPLPRLFPAHTMSASQVAGEWQLVASSAASWRARRNVRARFTPRDGAGSTGDGDGEGGEFGSSSSSMDAEWIFYEIASFQAKTLVQRVSEDVKARKAAQAAERRRREGTVEEEDEELQQRSGERTVSVSGRMWEERRGKCFAYRPNRPTLQKAMGKDIHWEVVSYGSASPSASPTLSSHPQPATSIDWFVAYAHPLPFLHPFISVYFRPEVVRDRPDTVTLLFEDIVDALRHATDVWGEDEVGEEVRVGEGQENEEEGERSNGDAHHRPASLTHHPNHRPPRRGRRRERGSGDTHSHDHDSDDDYMPVTGTGPSGAPLTSLSASVSRGTNNKKKTDGAGGAEVRASKEERRREDLRWELRRMAPEVRPVRGI